MSARAAIPPSGGTRRLTSRGDRSNAANHLLTDGADPVVIIDAVLDQGPAGRVLLIDARSDSRSTHLLSTHGVGVLEAIELARIAHPKEVAQKILIVGITIQNANRGGAGLSPPVSAAIPIAAAQALKLAENG